MRVYLRYNLAVQALGLVRVCYYCFAGRQTVSYRVKLLILTYAHFRTSVAMSLNQMDPDFRLLVVLIFMHIARSSSPRKLELFLPTMFLPTHLLLVTISVSFLNFCHAVVPKMGSPVCVPAAGVANLVHCKEAIDELMPGSYELDYHFSHQSTEPMERLPALYRRRNCLIVVNVLDSTARITGEWDDLRVAARWLVDACVRQRMGLGGHMRLDNGLYVSVWKPAHYVAMLLSTGGNVPTNLKFVSPMGPSWNPDTPGPGSNEGDLLTDATE